MWYIYKYPKDELGFLGLGTAEVIADNDAQALTYYRRALEIAPGNKTAKRNIAVLSEE